MRWQRGDEHLPGDIASVESHVSELLRHPGVHQALPPQLLNGVPLVQVSLSTVIIIIILGFWAPKS